MFIWEFAVKVKIRGHLTEKNQTTQTDVTPRTLKVFPILPNSIGGCVQPSSTTSDPNSSLQPQTWRLHLDLRNCSFLVSLSESGCFLRTLTIAASYRQPRGENMTAMQASCLQAGLCRCLRPPPSTAQSLSKNAQSCNSCCFDSLNKHQSHVFQRPHLLPLKLHTQTHTSTSVSTESLCLITEDNNKYVIRTN